jgi:hypothetical protein
MKTQTELTPDQIEALRQDYLYELATETGFGAPKLWNHNAPRSFQAFVAARTRINKDLAKAMDIIGIMA